MNGQDRRLGLVRDRLLAHYLAFGFGGLHFEERDISVEIAEARQRISEFLGREVRLPRRPSRLISLWVVTDEAGEIVGRAAREVGLRGSALVVAHKQLRIWPSEWRRRGFGSALLAGTRRWYEECGVQFIVTEAEGDGSVFAAVRGFDFDVTSYADRPGFRDLPENELRFAAINRLIRHPAVRENADVEPAELRESVMALLERVRASGTEAALQVDRFQRRLPQTAGRAPGTLTGDELTFTAPGEIAAFGRDTPLRVLDGRGLGAAVLALTGWSGITTL